MKNESPIGLATILGVIPGIIGAVVFIVALIKNGGDVDTANSVTTAAMVTISGVFTGWSRQRRAIEAPYAAAQVIMPDGGMPLDPDPGEADPPQVLTPNND